MEISENFQVDIIRQSSNSFFLLRRFQGTMRLRSIVTVKISHILNIQDTFSVKYSLDKIAVVILGDRLP